jgi:mycothione reductase
VIPYRTNADIMRMEELPRTLVILGGGIIAVEFAHVFSALGVEVIVINRSESLLRRFDSTVSSRFTELAGSSGRTCWATRSPGPVPRVAWSR